MVENKRRKTKIHEIFKRHYSYIIKNYPFSFEIRIFRETDGLEW